MKMLLNGGWVMVDGEKRYPCAVPCSAYDTLLKAGDMPDPYFRENEWVCNPISLRDFTFETRFTPDRELLSADKRVLTLEGVDTLADIRLNGVLLGQTDNMHRTWEYEVNDCLRAGENLLQVECHSPSRYIAAMQEKRPLWGVEHCMAGYPHLRKAHYMFGWDWGPKLPDMGVWRNVTVQGFTFGRIRSVYYTQRHDQDGVLLTCRAETEEWKEGMQARLTVLSPDGETFSAELKNGEAEIRIEKPRLWWVRGLGDQPLYECRVELMMDGQTADMHCRRIGLRTLTVSQEADQWGKEFCFINNGVKVFAMGANLIPQDQLLPRITRERTEQLIRECVEANFNFIRVWGGGVYPEDDFFDLCDEAGLIVWQDFMFACAAYRLTPAFEATVRLEIRDQLLRIRNHACLGLWCGNNEIEAAWEGWGLPEDPEARQDYLTLFESIIPRLVSQYDPETFYWPSSPSSGGGIKNASSNRAGDMHYWAVWHNFKPIEAFRAFYYRFCSEYGFESLPDKKTIEAMTGPEEKQPDLCGHVLEAHQKCTQGNEKIMFYLAQMVNYPYDFDRLIYCSQLVQADCIRSNVEHMRRARGRCMGSAYWQVNDSNPVISWSSVDYFGRWKALHYAAKKFYAPLLLSCDDTDKAHPVLYVTNDTPREAALEIHCSLKDQQGKTLEEFSASGVFPPLSAREALRLDLSGAFPAPEDQRRRYLAYTLTQAGRIIGRGTTLFVRPKAFDFLPPHISIRAEEKEEHFSLTLQADCFAKSVCLGLKEADGVFSDNWFDLHGEEPVTVTLEKKTLPAGFSLEELNKQLTVVSYGDAPKS